MAVESPLLQLALRLDAVFDASRLVPIGSGSLEPTISGTDPLARHDL